MKVTLERGDASLTLQRIGRTIFEQQGDGETQHGYFDDAAAEAALAVLLDARLAEGWTESAETRARREAEAARRAQAEERLRRHRALCEAPDPREALRAFLGDAVPAGPALDALLARVASVHTPTEGGFRVALTSGGALEWAAGEAPLEALWAYPDARAADGNQHALFFGPDAAPPEPPDELDGVAWFLEEWPNDRFWFTAPDAPTEARCYELDGGVAEPETPPRSPREVLLARLNDVLDDQ
ncbi:MAG: hypothetical protein JNJ54_09155 [Myxococcaceae bacterium]|nr:hypothetical protein [Myxococcaceae bacterium]